MIPEGWVPVSKHLIINEDGKEFMHRGYEIRKCFRCGDEFLAGIGSPADVCGGKNCGKEKLGVK